jgi:hypothetical protein
MCVVMYVMYIMYIVIKKATHLAIQYRGGKTRPFDSFHHTYPL